MSSMSDLFHKDVPPAFIDDVFNTMERVDRHVYQVLTKRSSRMRDYLLGRYASARAPRHMWCGVSVEDQRASVRVKRLQEAPARLKPTAAAMLATNGTTFPNVLIIATLCFLSVLFC